MKEKQQILLNYEFNDVIIRAEQNKKQLFQ